MGMKNSFIHSSIKSYLKSLTLHLKRKWEGTKQRQLRALPRFPPPASADPCLQQPLSWAQQKMQTQMEMELKMETRAKSNKREENENIKRKTAKKKNEGYKNLSQTWNLSTVCWSSPAETSNGFTKVLINGAKRGGREGEGGAWRRQSVARRVARLDPKILGTAVELLAEGTCIQLQLERLDWFGTSS